MNLLSMSFCGAALIACIVILRLLFIHRFPKKVFLVLWCASLLRLLVPYSLPASFSLYSLVGVRSADFSAERLAAGISGLLNAADGNQGMRLERADRADTGIQQSGDGRADAAQAADGKEADGKRKGDWQSTRGSLFGLNADNVTDVSRIASALKLVWLAGMLLMALYFLFLYLRSLKRFQSSDPVEQEAASRWLSEHGLLRTIELRQTDRILSPLTYGIFRPVILMPASTDWENEDVRYVLEHEFVHICSFDAVFKILFAAALCVHWFNPMVWVMYVLANRDLELACDETVVRRFGIEARRDYAQMLIHVAESVSDGLPLLSHFGKNAVEERIVAIMKIKKLSWAALVAAGLVTIGVIGVFGTTLRQDKTEMSEGALTMTNTDGAEYYDSSVTHSYEVNTELIDSGEEVQSQSYLPQETIAPPADRDIEWWTAEEYEKWLEKEKVNLQSVIGTRGYTSQMGWFTWTQELVDETIARYEEELKAIRNGMLLSKPVNVTYYQADGSIANEGTVVCTADQIQTEVGHRYLPDEATGAAVSSYDADACLPGEQINQETATGATAGAVSSYGVDVSLPNESINAETISEAFSTDEKKDAFPGKMVGDVYSHSDGNDREFKAYMKRFEKYGVTCEGKDSFVNLYYNGEPVRTLCDDNPDGTFTTVSSMDQSDGIILYAIYDKNGKLCGVQPGESVKHHYSPAGAE